MNLYLRSCFKGVKELIHSERKDQIIGVLGIKNEIIYLQNPITVKKNKGEGIN